MRIVLGLLIVVLGLLMGYSASRYQAPIIQADIDQRTEERLASLETATGIEIEADGRHVTLRGRAASEAEKERIIESASDVWGALGPIDEIELLEVAKPYELSVVKDEDGRIILSGVVPSEAAKMALLAEAKERFDDKIEDDLELAAGAPGGDWVGAVGRGMQGLAGLDHGRLAMVDGSIDLSGEAAFGEDVERIDALKAEPLDGFTWTGALDVAKPTIQPFTFAVEKDGGAWKVRGYAPDEATRGRLLAKIQAVAGEEEVIADIALADGMPDGDWPAATEAAVDAMARMETGTLDIADHDVQFDGDVASASDLEAIQALAADAPGSADWQSDLVVFRPTIRPYVVEIEKREGGGWALAGAVPDEASRDTLLKAATEAAAGGDVEVRLQLADGVPGVDWQAFVGDRLAALDSVDAGTLRFEDYDVSLDGVVATIDAAEEAGVEVAGIDPKIATDLEVLDPTVDAFLDLRLSPDDGVTLNGALPSGLSEQEAVEILGLEAGHDGELSENGRGDTLAWREDLATIGSYLPEFETVELSLKDGRAEIDGEVHAKSDAGQIVEKLTAALDQRWQPELKLAAINESPADGARRTNPLSGIDEEYRRGFWLPVTTVQAGLDACRMRTSAILASDKITFLVGEARLDARARRVINDLSAVAIGCLASSGLNLEIGGHTDSRGADDMNLKLSQSRADAVLDQLVARGVSMGALSANGYGETEPIADNASIDGRSANRRITFKWQDGPELDG